MVRFELVLSVLLGLWVVTLSLGLILVATAIRESAPTCPTPCACIYNPAERENMPEKGIDP